MDEQKQIIYGILGCCLGIVVGFAIGFPIIFQLSYEKRGYIGVPCMLILVLATCTIGGIIGVKLAKRSEKEPVEYDM
ncbi:hypothetical protein GXP67_06985 [Rhodocytophaga rosea]|uniref:Uncharacterized protein n=1 Tax=Rhodocytophaga rosea TaxID=2704465 RepID=A0A6C0GEK6_9BACT|nr:hypothetical protein [Rhodocytophaga rosea]QHT66421.1 hypothetical protein GXP67_06985 [Rhodocytophaga rosea]